MTVDPTTLSRLQEQLDDMTPLLGSRRRRRAAIQLAQLAQEASSEAIATLAESVSIGTDEGVTEIASVALSSLPEGSARDAFCRLAVEWGSTAVLAIATTAGYVPSEPNVRAALLALGGRWDELDSFDFDHVHLHAAHKAASPELRRRLTAAARQARRVEWVPVAVGGRQRRHLDELTRAEWHDLLALLARPDRADEAFRLAQVAPPLWSRALLLEIRDAAALPEHRREGFMRLRALAERCEEGSLSLDASTRWVATLAEYMGRVHALAVTPDGSLLASAGEDDNLHLWTLRSDMRLGRLTTEHANLLFGHEGSVPCLAVTPDGSLLASGSDDKTIRLWRLPDGECVARLRGHKDFVDSLSGTPNGSLLASGSHDKTIRLWRLPDGECVARLRRHRGAVSSLAVTPDGNMLASGSHDKTIRLWRLPHGECAGIVRGHEDFVGSLAVSPDGNLLASGSCDKSIRLWSLPDGERVATLQGHEGWVNALTVSPDGRLLASGSSDKTIRLWRLPDGEPLATLRGHESTVWSLSVTPDGSLLISGSSDGTIRLWSAQIATLASTPVAALAPNRLLTLQQDGESGGRGHAWLDFMLALVARDRRFDIEIGASTHLEVGEFDIEIGG